MSQLEFAIAFDRAACWLDGFRSPFLAIVSTPECADHVLSRATSGLTLLCDTQETFEHVQHRFRSGLLPRNVIETSEILNPGNSPAQRFNAVIWAMPRQATLAAHLDQIWRLTASQGRLVVFAPTGLGSLVRPFRAGDGGRQSDLSDSTVKNKLDANGWRIERHAAFGGLLSLGWALAGRVATQVGRADLADRAEQAHHAAVESPLGASYALWRAIRP